ncbi:MAG: hypothetical protein ANABAC_1395 [Anaerolineae bacterium]|nr:MAG: hypothetical protein ANABAC_1395 [Anaerolineae bacterium]
MGNIRNNSTDHDLHDQVRRALAAHPELREAEIRVGTANGFVHLAGKVSSLSVYLLIERIVKDIPGIKSVINRIEAPGAPSPSRSIHLSPQKSEVLNPSTKESEK